VGASHFVLFVFFVFCIFSTICSICGLLLLNAKFIVQRFFYFSLKGKKKTNIIKGKQKENDIEKFFFKFNFLRNYSLTLKLGILYFFGFVQYLPTPELEIFVGNVH
jgi:hypothetical protein